MLAMSSEVSCVLTDLSMPGWDGIKCLQYLAENYPEIPAVVLSGEGNVTDAVRAMKYGAVDYVAKPFDPEELFSTLEKAKKLKKTIQEKSTSMVEKPAAIKEDGKEEQYQSTRMRQAVSMIGKVAKVDTTVLLSGESGVGKSRFARLLHEMSPRADKPFVTVSCPALPPNLLESELFGHKKGAFTGAVTERSGKIEAARGGTLFLDEIGELPIDLQPKLLNVLQDGVYYPVGSETPVKCDIRLITASNIDFTEAVKEGTFREDLYYRLNVFPIEIPPLRERKDEIQKISENILESIGKTRGDKPHILNKRTLEHMQAFDWPGNIRQLRNVLERATIIAEDKHINPEDLAGIPSSTEEDNSTVLPEGLGGFPLKLIEKAAIMQTLDMVGGNKSKAARLLQITEKSVYNKLKRYSL